MNLKSKLPTNIRCATFELAFVLGQLLQQHGYAIDNNLIPSGDWLRGIPLEIQRNGTTVRIHHDTKRVTRYSDRGERCPIDVTCANTHDLIAALYETPIKVGDYEADIRPDGVQVGCQFVPWSVIETLLAQKPK